MILALLLASFALPATAATDMTIGEQTVRAGETARIPIDISSDGAAVHLQFDLAFDPSVAIPGAMAGGAALNGHGIDSETLALGVLRSVVYSTQGAQIGAGRLFDLAIDVAADAVPGRYPLTPSALIISDPEGLPIAADTLVEGALIILDAIPVPTPSIPMSAIFSPTSWRMPPTACRSKPPRGGSPGCRRIDKSARTTSKCASKTAPVCPTSKPIH